MMLDTTMNLHELNETSVRLSLVLNFRSTPFHRPGVISYHGSIPFVLVSVLHRWDNPGENANHVRHLRHHSQLERKPSVNGGNASRVTRCSRASRKKLQDRPQASWSWRLLHFLENQSQRVERHSKLPLVITHSDIKLKVSEELHYLRNYEYSRINRLRTKLWEFLIQEWECRAISV